jgi:hypothetical protein
MTMKMATTIGTAMTMEMAAAMRTAMTMKPDITMVAAGKTVPASPPGQRG